MTPWAVAHQASLSITNSWGLLKLMSIQSVMSSNHLILCRPLLLLHSIFPSMRIFSNESILHIRRPKYWSFSISPSNEHSGLISSRMDWLDLFAVQGRKMPSNKKTNKKSPSEYLFQMLPLMSAEQTGPLECLRCRLISGFLRV